MALPAGDDQIGPEERLEAHCRIERVRRAHPHGEIQRLVAHERLQSGAYAFDYSYPRAGVAAPELRYGFGGQQDAMLGSHAKGYAAVGAALKRFQIFVDLAKLRLNDPRSCEKRLASAACGGTAGISLQKLDVKLLLKLTDTFGNRRLRDADFSRRGAQAARFDDGKKVSNLAEPHRL